MKQYNSFVEIDERLRILRLQREIDTESIKLHLNQAKSSLYPTRWVGGFNGLAQKVILTFAIKKLSDFSRRFRGLGRNKEIPLRSE